MADTQRLDRDDRFELRRPAGEVDSALAGLVRAVEQAMRRRGSPVVVTAEPIRLRVRALEGGLPDASLAEEVRKAVNECGAVELVAESTPHRTKQEDAALRFVAHSAICETCSTHWCEPAHALWMRFKFSEDRENLPVLCDLGRALLAQAHAPA